MQWLALLAIAVVLPTVSLLWFMTRVIVNERLVVRQKLAALYQDKLVDASARTRSLFNARLATLDRLNPPANLYTPFRRLVLENNFQGIVVWDAEGNLVYPRTSDVVGNDVPSDSPLAAAWQTEFAGHHYAEAADLYESHTGDRDPRVALAATTGRSRCLWRLGRIDEAIEQCQKIALAPPPDNGDPALRFTIENARLLLLSLLRQANRPQAYNTVFNRTVEVLIADLYHSGSDRATLPAGQNLFVARKTLEALSGPYRFEDRKAKDQLEQLVTAESLSVAAAETLRPATSVSDSLFQTTLDQKPVYAVRHRVQSLTVLAILSEAGMGSLLSGYHDTFTGSESTYRVVNNAGAFVSGQSVPPGTPYAVVSLPEAFPGWKVELYFQGSDIFEKAARRQIAIYIWTGALVILLVVMAGGFAMRAVGRQIRLNEMKNDFIATVSHELKTPLASMRVLVDTLLEGRVKDEAQVREYLRLTAKENERLSRMIDNFLSFSRMERNKKAFTLADASPAAIARDAAESVQTRFATHNCRLAMEIAVPLPDINADHDAIVTVLVNLLDNACKYTAEDKRIALKVFSDNGSVCFAVSDNGIGLARRHLRKIFDSFYQVDSSLARKAEGCGLGLSIVKFIVDAHKGTITVESQPGQGSIFTVRLPVAGPPQSEDN